ncbi:MAG: DEAD/DEAH box helicase [Candidatus Obscuribacterales bacterium]|nr:DEAD/DEAH box helicase [Candidatus Obscuribacterales bacterium]
MDRLAISALRKHTAIYFDFRTVRKGQDYFCRGKVASALLTEPQRIHGIVQGSQGQSYETSVSINTNNSHIKETSCSCPVRERCKHAVAIILAFCIEHPNGVTFDTTKLSPEEAATNALLRQLRESAHNINAPGDEASLGKNIKEETETEQASKKSDRNLYLKLPSRDIERRLGTIAAAFSAAMSESKENEEKEKLSPSDFGQQLIYVLHDSEFSSRPSIILNQSKLKKNGKFGAIYEVGLHKLIDPENSAFITKADQEIADLWLFRQGPNAPTSYFRTFDEVLDVHSELTNVIVQKVVATGRAYARSLHSKPLKIGAKLKGHLVWTEADDLLRLDVVALAPNDALFPCLRWHTPWYLDAVNSICGPVDINIGLEILDLLLALPPITREEVAGFSLMLAEQNLQDLVPTPPGSEQFQTLLKSPIPVMKIMTLRAQNKLKMKTGAPLEEEQTVLSAALSFEAVSLNPFPYADDNGNLILEKEDLEAKKKAHSQLKQYGLLELDQAITGTLHSGTTFYGMEKPSQWLEFAKDIETLRRQGWKISHETEEDLSPLDLHEDNLTIGIEEQDASFWFSMSLSIDVDGKKMSLLPILIAAIRGLKFHAELTPEAIEQLNYNDKFVAILPNGKMISLPFDRVRTILLSLQEILWKVMQSTDKVKLSFLEAADLLSSPALANAHWSGGDRLRDLAKQLRKLMFGGASKCPQTLKTELRPYQIEGVAWLQLLAETGFGGILADDMGLGKTIQLLAHICLEKEKGELKTPFLVVCPTSVVPNWQAEAQRFAPDLKIMTITGKDRSQNFDKLYHYDLVFSTYALLVKDEEKLKEIDWHGIALDEAQSVKNHKTAAAKVLLKLKTKQRFCMTGTPIQNHIGELWSYFSFLVPGLLGEITTFNANIRNPIEKDGNSVVRDALITRLKPFILRRTKQQVLAELPERTTVVKYVELEHGQRDLYEIVRLSSTKRVRDEIDKKGFKLSQIMILSALLQLRQVCCDPHLVKLPAAEKAHSSAKLEALMAMLPELVEEGRKILVFSQFTSMLDIIKRRLLERGLLFVELNGATKDRKTPVESFQSGLVPIFLISLKAGGTGLNLTAADTVIHYDPWWNPAAENQASDRAHRIGQTRDVFIYKLIARGTIEQRMIELQDRKQALMSAIIDQSGGKTPVLDADDLDALMRPIDDWT